MILKTSPSGEEFFVEAGEKTISLAPSPAGVVGWEVSGGDYVQVSASVAGELNFPLSTFQGVKLAALRAVVQFVSSGSVAAEFPFSVAVQRQTYDADGVSVWESLAVSGEYSYSPLLVEIPVAVSAPLSVGLPGERYRVIISGESGNDARQATLIDIISETATP